MERLAQIEQLIEVGREEGPRLVTERAREAVDALEAGLDTALATVMERVRPERRGPGRLQLLLVALAVAALTAVVGFVIARLVERQRAAGRRRGETAPFAIPVVSPKEAAPLEAAAGEEELSETLAAS
jgi:hypothetical protein